MNLEVVGIGDICLDLTATLDRIPKTDMMEKLIDTCTQGGGKVPTAMVTLARLGVRSGLASTYGDDNAGKFCLEELIDLGVDTSCMIKLENTRTNLTICLAEKETQGRSFIGRYDLLRTIAPEELNREYITGARYLHLWQMTPAAILATQWMHEAGGKVVFDADRYSSNIEANLDKLDIFICSEFFYYCMFGEDAREEDLKKNLNFIRSRGPEIVVVTCGKKGYAGIEANSFFQGPAFTGINVVDTTGAGDVFHGAFIYGMLQGWSADRSAIFSSAVSAIKCTAIGGRTGIPDAATAHKFIETGEIDRTVIEHWTRYYQMHRFI